MARYKCAECLIVVLMITFIQSSVSAQNPYYIQWLHPMMNSVSGQNVRRWGSYAHRATSGSHRTVFLGGGPRAQASEIRNVIEVPPN